MGLRLLPEIAASLKDNATLRLKVQGAITASHNTMMKYIDENSIRLTELDSLVIICEDLGKPLSEVVCGSGLETLKL